MCTVRSLNAIVMSWRCEQINLPYYLPLFNYLTLVMSQTVTHSSKPNAACNSNYTLTLETLTPTVHQLSSISTPWINGRQDFSNFIQYLKSFWQCWKNLTKWNCFPRTFHNWLGKLKVTSLILAWVEVSWTLVASELLELWGFLAMASLSFQLNSSFWYIFRYNFVKTKSGGRRLYPMLCWHIIPKAVLYRLYCIVELRRGKIERLSRKVRFTSRLMNSKVRWLSSKVVQQLNFEFGCFIL